ncbi:NF038122 family metalloprotease, partial [Bradyrhizobium sp. HKCCYLS3013]
YNGNLVGSAPGTDLTLQSLEASFHQDLNGDGTIGILPSSSVAVVGVKAVTPSGSDLILASSTFSGTLFGNIGPLFQDSFHFAADGQGGTLISGTSISGAASSSVSLQGHDTFVFAEHFGQVTVSDFNPGTDQIVFSQSIFAEQSALQAAIHDDAAGNAVITDAALDTITIQHVSAAELLSHLSSFHLV